MRHATRWLGIAGVIPAGLGGVLRIPFVDPRLTRQSLPMGANEGPRSPSIEVATGWVIGGTLAAAFSSSGGMALRTSERWRTKEPGAESWPAMPSPSWRNWSSNAVRRKRPSNVLCGTLVTQAPVGRT
jgi:hypothetical protein